MIKDKNVLYICNYAANYSGNFIACLSRLAERLMIDNNVIFLFPSEAKNKEWLKNLPVKEENIYFCDFNMISLKNKCSYLSKKFKDKSMIVHTHFVDGLLLLPVKVNFKNIICHFHCTIYKSNNFLERALKKIVRNFIYKNIIIVGVSKSVTDDLKSYFRFNTCKCIVNAIDFQTLNNNSKEKKEIINNYNNKFFNVLLFGTNFITKGADIAINAINKLNNNSCVKYKLYITSHNIEETKKLVNDFTNNEFIEVIDVVENVKNLYDKVDVFIAPSRKEAFGYAVVESAYSDCQVIASDIPGQDTMKSVPGIIWVKKEDIESLKNGILEAYSNKVNNKVEKIKKEQKSYVIKNFSVNNWIEDNIYLYNQYIN
ncbi:glycosyltransferase family 4 protein [Clostridium perfringens]